MLLAGIDYSMTSPAICVFHGDIGKWHVGLCQFHFLSKVKKYAKLDDFQVLGYEYPDFSGENECKRYDFISDWAMEIVRNAKFVALEGYAYSATGRVFHIAENTGLLKWKIWQKHVEPCLIVEPTVVKKFATGKGNASKPEMHEAFKRETGIDLWAKVTPGKKDVGNPTSDLVDAYYICKWLHDSLDV